MPTGLSGRNDANIGSDSSDGGMKARKTRPASLTTAAHSTESKDDVVEPLPKQPLTNMEIIKMLNMTAARNRVLEVEIKTLFKRVSLPNPEQAYLAVT
jgi:hypothetical protein